MFVPNQDEQDNDGNYDGLGVNHLTTSSTLTVQPHPQA